VVVDKKINKYQGVKPKLDEATALITKFGEDLDKSLGEAHLTDKGHAFLHVLISKKLINLAWSVRSKSKRGEVLGV
jgi:hypothetical protein